MLKEFTVPASIVAALSVFLFMLKNPLSLDDGLRHFAMAKVMAEKGILNTAGWSEFFYGGYLSNLKTDPWFLSDALMVPLVQLPADTALKIFTVFTLVCIAVASVLALKSLRVNKVLSTVAIALLFFGDQQFLGRLLIARPFSLMTAVFILSIYTIIKRRYIVAGVVMMIAVLLSQLFVFPLALFILAVCWLFFTRRQKSACVLACCTVAGLAAGLYLHPHNTEYLQYLYSAFVQIPFLQNPIELSREMQSGFMDVSGAGVIILLGSATVLTLLEWRMRGAAFFRTPSFFLLLVALLLLPFYVLWVRSIDLLWPVLVLLNAGLASLQLKPVMKFARFLSAKKLFRILGSAYAAAQVLLVPGWFALHNYENTLSVYNVLENIPSGARVLNLDWERFFAYVSVRPDLEYAAGIDPSFTYLTEPEAAEDLKNLQDEQLATVKDPSVSAATFMQSLLKLYPAEYLAVHKGNYDTLIKLAETLPFLKPVGESPAMMIYSVE